MLSYPLRIRHVRSFRKYFTSSTILRALKPNPKIGMKITSLTNPLLRLVETLLIYYSSFHSYIEPGRFTIFLKFRPDSKLSIWCWFSISQRPTSSLFFRIWTSNGRWSLTKLRSSPTPWSCQPRCVPCNTLHPNRACTHTMDFGFCFALFWLGM